MSLQLKGKDEVFVHMWGNVIEPALNGYEIMTMGSCKLMGAGFPTHQ
jgi:hypothetical protein